MSIKIAYPEMSRTSKRRGHIMKNGEPLCGNKMTISAGGIYTITRETQAPDVWCKSCKEMANLPWE